MIDQCWPPKNGVRYGVVIKSVVLKDADGAPIPSSNGGGTQASIDGLQGVASNGQDPIWLRAMASYEQPLDRASAARIPVTAVVRLRVGPLLGDATPTGTRTLLQLDRPLTFEVEVPIDPILEPANPGSAFVG